MFKIRLDAGGKRVLMRKEQQRDLEGYKIRRNFPSPHAKCQRANCAFSFFTQRIISELVKLVDCGRNRILQKKQNELLYKTCLSSLTYKLNYPRGSTSSRVTTEELTLLYTHIDCSSEHLYSLFKFPPGSATEKDNQQRLSSRVH